MKLTLKKGDKEMSIDVIESRIEGSVSDFIINLYQKLFTEEIPITIDTPKGDSETFAEHYGCLPVEPPSENDSFTIRKRLPNNVIDINKLTVKEAVIESVLVRCPNCGQSHAIILKDGPSLYLMKHNYDTKEFDIVAQFPANDNKLLIKQYCAEDDTIEKKLDYFYHVNSMIPFIQNNFNVSECSEIFCPVCRKSANFSMWKDAYINKERYFEYEYICGACGGECVMDAQEEKDGKGLVVCTKCGKRWEKEWL